MPQLSFLPWLVALILCVPALFFVLYPLYQRMPPGAQAIAGEEHQAALPSQVEHEQAAHSALTEVELDYQLGNLAEPDYRSLRERYLLRAYTAHKSIQAREQQLDAQIEDRLRQMRAEQETNPDDEVDHEDEAR